MKLGVMSAYLGVKSWEEACKTAEDKGLEAIEVGSGGFVGKMFLDPEKLLKDKDEIKKFKRIADKYNLEISALSCHGNPLHPNKSFAEEHIRDLRNSIELAPRLGVKVVNCFAGCPGAGEDAKYPNWVTCSYPKYFEEIIKWQWEKRVIPFWKEIASIARNVGVKIGLEIHVGDVIYNTEVFLKLREEIGEEISCNMDPAHLFWQGMNPIICIEKLGKAIVHVHAKDIKINQSIVEFRGVLDWKNYGEVAKRAWSFRTVGYGHGMDFWNDFVSTLRIVGYDGVISIEHEDPIMSPNEGLNKAIEFLRKVIIYEKPGEMYWI
jgi:sugar phosphate isomerase/epimerase